MSARDFAGIRFVEAGAIRPERDAQGRIVAHRPQTRFARADATPLHRHGAGPFCRFRLQGLPDLGGLYLLTADDAVLYAGECASLRVRWGGRGYGSIAPRNCFRGGQETNCRINAAILAEAEAGRRLALLFCAMPGAGRLERRAAEARLIAGIRPPWNLRGAA